MDKEQRSLAKEVADKLWGAFAWSDTPQGSDYWLEVAKNLCALAEAKVEPVSQEPPLCLSRIAKSLYACRTVADIYIKGSEPQIRILTLLAFLTQEWAKESERAGYPHENIAGFLREAENGA